MGLRDLFRRRPPARPADPNRPHEFKRLSDNWLGHGVVPLRGPAGATVEIVGAAMQFTGQQCAICRRLPDDPIHDPEG
jgi:hypothetical protein